jgi:hypothetical protein
LIGGNLPVIKQLLTLNLKLVSCESIAKQQGPEHGGRNIYTVDSCCLATAIEQTEDVMCAATAVLCRVCRLVKALQLSVVMSITSYKRS